MADHDPNPSSADTDRQPDDTVKDPDDWVTGDEPLTGAQHSYLETLARQTGEEVEQDLSKAEASKEIDRLRHERDDG